MFDEAEIESMKRIIENDPTIYLTELAYEVHRATGKYADPTTISKALKRAGFTKKKIQALHSSRDVDAHARFICRIARHSFREFVWMDETGSQVRHSLRRMGWGPVNKRVRVRIPKIDGKRYSIAACMSYRGAGPARLVHGSINRVEFLEYAQDMLLPAMNPHWDANGNATGLPLSVLVLDNCATHK
jgi:hypothetical protein